MKITFNKELKEGLAKFLDSLSAAAIVGGVVALAGHTTIANCEIAALFCVAFVMLCLSIYLRMSISS